MVHSRSTEDSVGVIKLHDYLTDNLKTPFVWGEFDCATFVSNWILLKTSVDILSDIPMWTTAREAALNLKAEGGIEAAADKRLKRIHPNLANDGDIALYGKTLCIFSGSKIVGPSKNGLIYIDRTKALCAWSHSSFS